MLSKKIKSILKRMEVLKNSYADNLSDFVEREFQEEKPYIGYYYALFEIDNFIIKYDLRDNNLVRLYGYDNLGIKISGAEFRKIPEVKMFEEIFKEKDEYTPKVCYYGKDFIVYKKNSQTWLRDIKNENEDLGAYLNIAKNIQNMILKYIKEGMLIADLSREDIYYDKSFENDIYLVNHCFVNIEDVKKEHPDFLKNMSDVEIMLFCYNIIASDFGF